MFHNKVWHVFWNSRSLHVVKILEKYLWRISYFCKAACWGPATFLKMNFSIFQWLWVQVKKTAMRSSYLQKVVKAVWGVLQRYVFIEHLPGYFLHFKSCNSTSITTFTNTTIFRLTLQIHFKMRKGCKKASLKVFPSNFYNSRNLPLKLSDF